MNKSKEQYNLPDINDFFERTHGNYVGRIENIDIKKLKNFKDHPFKIRDDDEMKQLISSIQENGILNPIIVRETKDGNF
ncbi:MAG: ParB N-terminal domain-containing protein [Clostridia bacterium]|nr:ParB N-terminal domain-containing protein [Clostridia bacterium]